MMPFEAGKGGTEKDVKESVLTKKDLEEGLATVFSAISALQYDILTVKRGMVDLKSDISSLKADYMNLNKGHEWVQNRIEEITRLIRKNNGD